MLMKLPTGPCCNKSEGVRSCYSRAPLRAVVKKVAEGQATSGVHLIERVSGVRGNVGKLSVVQIVVEHFRLR